MNGTLQEDEFREFSISIDENFSINNSENVLSLNDLTNEFSLNQLSIDQSLIATNSIQNNSIISLSDEPSKKDLSLSFESSQSINDISISSNHLMNEIEKDLMNKIEKDLTNNKSLEPIKDVSISASKTNDGETFDEQSSQFINDISISSNHLTNKIEKDLTNNKSLESIKDVSIPESKIIDGETFDELSSESTNNDFSTNKLSDMSNNGSVIGNLENLRPSMTIDNHFDFRQTEDLNKMNVQLKLDIESIRTKLKMEEERSKRLEKEYENPTRCPNEKYLKDLQMLQDHSDHLYIEKENILKSNRKEIINVKNKSNEIVEEIFQRKLNLTALHEEENEMKETINHFKTLYNEKESMKQMGEDFKKMSEDVVTNLKDEFKKEMAKNNGRINEMNNQIKNLIATEDKLKNDEKLYEKKLIELESELDKKFLDLKIHSHNK
ncbi:hypothetical protein SNEBB_004301 [Seison nebaliae]|nr:hypothetical protein SNEBB_004301 [Seison nebaliae]